MILSLGFHTGPMLPPETNSAGKLMILRSALPVRTAFTQRTTRRMTGLGSQRMRATGSEFFKKNSLVNPWHRQVAGGAGDGHDAAMSEFQEHAGGGTILRHFVRPGAGKEIRGISCITANLYPVYTLRGFHILEKPKPWKCFPLAVAKSVTL
jgi:hypothetical protein